VVAVAVNLIVLDEYAGASAFGCAACKLVRDCPVRMTPEAFLFVFFVPPFDFLFRLLAFLFNPFLICNYRVDLLRCYLRSWLP